MAETNESTVTEDTNQDAPSTPEPADQTDWKAQARKWEALAKQNKDAAARLAEIEEASKSDTEKQTARADQAEARANPLVARVLAAEIAKAAIEAKAIDGDAVALEHLTAIKRAGADLILTYLAREVAEALG